MKNFIFTLFLLCILAAGAFGQTDGMLNLRSYASYFLYKNNLLDADYEVAVIDEDYYDIVATLGGNSPTLVDTPLEIALLSICAGVADIRPAEANRMLGNAKQADQKLGAAVYQEMQILRFLADTAAVNRHETVLKFITDRGNAIRAEIETYYRNGIRGLVSAVVDENIAKSRFGAPTAEALANIKNVITQFFLNPTLDNFRVMDQHIGYYANTDGNRGRAARDILYYSVQSFSVALSDALASGRLPASAR